MQDPVTKMSLAKWLREVSHRPGVHAEEIYNSFVHYEWVFDKSQPWKKLEVPNNPGTIFARDAGLAKGTSKSSEVFSEEVTLQRLGDYPYYNPAHNPDYCYAKDYVFCRTRASAEHLFDGPLDDTWYEIDMN